MNADDAILLRDLIQRQNDQAAAMLLVIEASDALHDALMRRDGDVFEAVRRYRERRQAYSLLVANAPTAIANEHDNES